MNAQHTPRPWINYGSEISAQVDPANPSYIAPVCFVDTDWHPEIVAANARLISAAPDLLEFVKEWLGRQGTDQNYMTAKARAAIAKATGGAA